MHLCVFIHRGNTSVLHKKVTPDLHLKYSIVRFVLSDKKWKFLNTIICCVIIKSCVVAIY